MKKKEITKSILDWGARILFFSILIMSILIHFGVFDNQEFTIYKEECWNESVFNQTLLEERNKLKSEIFDLENDRTPYRYCEDFPELEIEYCKTYKDKLKELVEEIIDLEKTIENNSIIKERCEKVEVKGDWENECQEFEEGKGCFSPYYDGIEWLKNNCEGYSGDICDDLECSNRDWEQYKCGDYYVGVKLK